MSIDLNWETLTTGPDGLDLAHKIRDFIHTKFQSVPLPRFIKSVTVHDFEFGSIPPELELKDITDPLPDFYEDNSDIDDSEDDGSGDDAHVPEEVKAASDRRRRAEEAVLARSNEGHLPPHINTVGGLRNSLHLQDLGSPFLGVSTPGMPLGGSNLHYFHSHFANNLSGTQTPLAAVAGAQHLMEPGHGHSLSMPNLQAMAQGQVDSHPPSHSRNPSQSSISVGDFNNPLSPLTPTNPTAPVPGPGSSSGLGIGHPHPALREKHSVSTLAPTSAGTSRPPTRDTHILVESAIEEGDDEEGAPLHGQQKHFRERRAEDIMAVFRIKYSGDVKLLLTTEILLDYPMPSFVGIPVRLSITGLTFDGVGVVAHIRKRVHFCFLSPEDAFTAIGGDAAGESAAGGAKLGGLLQEIRVESEIGQRESGKQSLKNVGKVERFVLEQVRRIFEEEFVYPSFWTFLV
ncbi:hypothetical protein GQ53DRAFT_741401 [Thozetella sp. PMI_491]|nr:hypothetical protein GQ53DRAFT_741401 [Thozetella sp. PMI_491]